MKLCMVILFYLRSDFGFPKFGHGSTRPHIVEKTGEIIIQFGWEKLPHPLLSLVLVSSDFHLFGLHIEFLCGTVFSSVETFWKNTKANFSMGKLCIIKWRFIFKRKRIFFLGEFLFVLLQTSIYLLTDLRNNRHTRINKNFFFFCLGAGVIECVWLRCIVLQACRYIKIWQTSINDILVQIWPHLYVRKVAIHYHYGKIHFELET